MCHDFPVLFDANHLAYVTRTRPQTLGGMRSQPWRFYRPFWIPKRRGGSREINAPTPALRNVQAWIASEVLASFRPHECCHGFVKGRSIVSNAKPHVAHRVLLAIDIRDFFGSVSPSVVFRLFRRVGYSVDVSKLLTSLTTLRGALPQGAPTSPMLANMAAYSLDCRLNGYARRHALVCTRYADDLTFSGYSSGGQPVKRTIESILRDEGFAPNESKTRYMRRDVRQEVTGVVVNERLNAPRDRRRWLRQEIYYLTKYGVENHLRARGYDQRRYKEFLYGHVAALNQTRPDEAGRYFRLLDEVDWPY